MIREKKNYVIIGIDEAGRGPLAGPVSVAAVAVTVNAKPIYRNSKQIQNLKFKNSKLLKNIRDSKKLSAKQREEWAEVIKKKFKYSVVMISAKTIDKIGISRAIKLATARLLRQLSTSEVNSWEKPDLVLLDGSLKAPKKYNQKTIIKGDEKIAIISAASIMAKTTRDAKMMRLHKKIPEYGFDKHKGYGTKLHYQKIKKHGVSSIHRRTYLKNLISE